MLVWAASGQIGGSLGVPRVDTAMVQSVDDPTLGKIDHPESNNVVGSQTGTGPSWHVRTVVGGQTTATRVSESTGINDPGG